VVGTTARLDAIQAAILRLKLSRLEDWNQARRLVADRLREALVDAEEIVSPPPAQPDGDHVYHQFVVRTSQREAARELLAQEGVATGVHYPIPIHRSEAYEALAEECDPAPHATQLAEEILSLPIFPSMTEDQIGRIGTALRRCSTRIRDSVLALPG
jgi:dTDP-3-amino-3,4,6-trideoxy-alpha-D-glucose transaminase